MTECECLCRHAGLYNLGHTHRHTHTLSLEPVPAPFVSGLLFTKGISCLLFGENTRNKKRLLLSSEAVFVFSDLSALCVQIFKDRLGYATSHRPAQEGWP